jgi:Fe-S cluster assembly protein SufB
LKLVLQLLGNTQVVFFDGDNSQGEFYSVALTNNYQQADTGTKMTHIGKIHEVGLFLKGFLLVNQNSYRGLVNVTTKAVGAKIIHSVILWKSIECKYFPVISVQNSTTKSNMKPQHRKSVKSKFFIFYSEAFV